MSEWRLTHAERPWTVNWERNHHWRRVGERVKEWRETFRLLALDAKVPACEQVVVDVFVESKSRRWMADPGACWGAVKAAVDGIVDAGVIPDDTGEEIVWYRLWPPTVTGRDALTLVVTSLPEVTT